MRNKELQPKFVQRGCDGKLPANDDEDGAVWLHNSVHTRVELIIKKSVCEISLREKSILKLLEFQRSEQQTIRHLKGDVKIFKRFTSEARNLNEKKTVCHYQTI